MVNFKKLADRAKDVVEKRGGPEGLKGDASNLREIAKGKGSLKDKALAAKDALQEPSGAGRRDARPAGGDHEGHGAHGHRPHEEGSSPSNPAAAPAHEPTPEAKERHSGGTAGTNR